MREALLTIMTRKYLPFQRYESRRPEQAPWLCPLLVGGDQMLSLRLMWPVTSFGSAVSLLEVFAYRYSRVQEVIMFKVIYLLTHLR